MGYFRVIFANFTHRLPAIGEVLYEISLLVRFFIINNAN